MTKQQLNSLTTESRRWVQGILRTFQLESHHEQLLLTCGQCLDRIADARAEVERKGSYYEDKHGVVRPHPGLKVEHAAKVLFNRSLRELDLDGEVLPESRAPGIRSNRTLTAIRGRNHAA